MPLNIEALRKRYPGYSDDEILTGLQATQYPEYSIGEIKSAIGYKPPKRSLMAVANDTVIEAANAAAGGLSSAAEFVSPGNRFSNFIDENIIQAGEAKQSDAVKDEKQRFQEEVAGAEGIGDELAAVGGYVARNPLQATAQAAGSFVLPGAAVKGAGGLATALGAGSRAAAGAGMAGGALAGAAMAGGDAAQTAYDLVIKAGGTEEQATAAARQASVIPGAIGGVSGIFGAERIFAGGKGFTGNAASRALKTGASEAAQEGVEEGVTQFEGQRAAVPYDPSIDPSKGVAAAAGMGAALGGITGAGVSLISPDQQREQAIARLSQARTVDEAIAAATDLASPPTSLMGKARMTAGQENAALSTLEQQAQADLNDIRQAGRQDKTGMPLRPGVPTTGADGSATVTDSPFADRVLILREQMADPTVRQQVRDKFGEQALNEVSYYASIADRADIDMPEKTRDRMLQLAEKVITDAVLQKIDDAKPLGSRAFTSPGQLAANPSAPRIGLDTTPTGAIRVDGQVNAAPETRADAIDTRQRVDQMRERNQGGPGMAEQTPRDQLRGAGPGVMVGDGTQTAAPRPLRERLKLTNEATREQPDVPSPAGVAVPAAAGGSNQPAGSGGDVGQLPADAGRGVEPAAEAPGRRGIPASPVGDGRAEPDETLSGLSRQWQEAARAGDSVKMRDLNERIVALKRAKQDAEPQMKQPAEAPPAVAGEKIDAEWTAFTPESGTKGIPRAEMPQIRAEHRGAMTQFLKGRGIVHEQEADVDPATLKPTQGEFSPAKVQQAREYTGGDRSILVSSDGYVLDGHHQWLAKREVGAPIRVIRFDAPITKLVDEAKQFPSAEQSEGAAATALGAKVQINERVERAQETAEAPTPQPTVDAAPAAESMAEAPTQSTPLSQEPDVNAPVKEEADPLSQEKQEDPAATPPTDSATQKAVPAAVKPVDLVALRKRRSVLKSLLGCVSA